MDTERILGAIFKMNDHFEKVYDRLDKIDGRLDNVDLRMDNLESRMDNLESQVNNLGEKFDALTLEFGDIKERLGRLETSIPEDYKAMMHLIEHRDDGQIEGNTADIAVLNNRLLKVESTVYRMTEQ